MTTRLSNFISAAMYSMLLSSAVLWSSATCKIATISAAGALRPTRVRYSMSSTSSFPSQREQNFRTEVTIPSSKWKLTHLDSTMFIGSCFSEVISRELKRRNFLVNCNPQGILFNPVSISQCLQNIATQKVFTLKDLFQDHILQSQNESLFHSWQHHSTFSGANVDEVMSHMNNRIRRASDVLQTAKCIYITLGSAFAHILTSNNEVVANCHKQPSTQFRKKMLSIEDITSSLSSAIQACRAVNSNIKVVITVSPIRHTREGMVQNQLSKSTLLCAAHALASELTGVTYFPSYEIMMDDLRDYRFYAEDMIHPSKLAETYILNKFAECYFSSETMTLCTKILEILANVEHRPIVKSGSAYRDHISRTLKLIDSFVSENTQSFAIDLKSEFAEEVKTLLKSTAQYK